MESYRLDEKFKTFRGVHFQQFIPEPEAKEREQIAAKMKSAFSLSFFLLSLSVSQRSIRGRYGSSRLKTISTVFGGESNPKRTAPHAFSELFFWWLVLMGEATGDVSGLLNLRGRKIFFGIARNVCELLLNLNRKVGCSEKKSRRNARKNWSSYQVL